MTLESESLDLAVRDHPAGRRELTGNRSFLADVRQRGVRGSDVSELFHENTKLDRRYLNRSALTTDALPDGFAVVEHDYHGCESVSLPDPEAVDGDLGALLDRRRSVRDYADRPVTKRTLGTLLGHAMGPTAERAAEPYDETFRPYPSAGGLYPVEVYPVVVNGDGVADGVYYYSVRDHALRVLDDGDEALAGFTDAFMDADFSAGIAADSAVTFVLTGSFPRIKAKYGPTGYRFALLEAGHLAQTLLLVAAALGLGGVPVGSYLGDLDEFLGVDGVDESALYTVPVGHPETHE
ncbi:SagB/ThcOx family dehydrogenase [Halomicrobium salinisoli]|uniref:SagB/ThcOx family dehydrogenase n=1 Tax=Halomicrobium salinisoli TaxID=2878391 RepID=UPI001CF0A957|nr:SagB/ThcOx family dehydrogenase [Halomicrobium salinisoli]